MKKLITLCLIILPIVLMAQKSNGSLDDFFNKYSEYSGYESLKVTEDMFKMFRSMEDADPEMVAFMGKLKSVRYLEYAGLRGVATGITVVNGEKSENIAYSYYVDGKKVTTSEKGGSTGIAKSKKDSETDIVGGSANITPTVVSKSVVYDRAIDEVNLSGFTELMKSNQDGEKTMLLKKEWSATDKEFLLLSGNKMVNIRGDIDIKHLYQLDEILDGIVDVMDMYPL